MGRSERSWRVGGGAFAWRRGGWRRGGACAQRVGVAGLARCVEVARFSRGGLGSWWGLHVVASLAHRDRVVPADLRVAKGGGGGHGLCAARQRWWGLEGRDMGIGIMWWRGGGLRSRRVGERGSR